MPCVVLRFHPFFVRRRAKHAQRLQNISIRAQAPNPEFNHLPTPAEATISAPQLTPTPLTSQFQNFSPDDIIQIQHPRLSFSEPDCVQPQSPEVTATGLARFRQKLQTGATKVKEVHQAPIVEQLDIKPARFKRRMSRDDLLNEESRLGSTIFGPIPVGHHREFFHDHNNVWIWYESWRDANRHQRQITVRYEIRPTGVYKKFTAGKYIPLEGAELHNFRKATHAYLKVIREGLYGQTAPATIATV